MARPFSKTKLLWHFTSHSVREEGVNDLLYPLYGEGATVWLCYITLSVCARRGWQCVLVCIFTVKQIFQICDILLQISWQAVHFSHVNFRSVMRSKRWYVFMIASSGNIFYWIALHCNDGIAAVHFYAYVSASRGGEWRRLTNYISLGKESSLPLHNVICMASGINFYSYITISLIRISDIAI